MAERMLRVGVVGVGHLGACHAGAYQRIDGVRLIGVCDTRPQRCAEVAARYGVTGYEDHRLLIPCVDAVSVAVPTRTHAAVASAFLAAGKAVLVEKPLAADLHQAEQLVRLARRHHCILQVGHIERFNPVLQAVPDQAEPPLLIQCQRLGPYSFRSTDIGVVHDLMIHDLDLVLSLLGQYPHRVEASAWSVFGGCEDVATARLDFPCGTVVQLTASRADVAARREMTLWWPDRLVRLDLAAKRSTTAQATTAARRERHRFIHPPADQIAELRQALTTRYFTVQQQQWTSQSDQLQQELEAFVNCVRTGQEPTVNGERACDAIRLAEELLNSAGQQRPLRLAA